ncbi:MAG: hypothetical protein JWR03_251, partial [Cohnella sp.]|nr:hypothetical protein [Cohnella sp.]
MSNFATGLVKITETFAPMIERQLIGNGVNMDQYARQCVINAISAINTTLDSKGISWSDEQLDKNNVTQTLMNVAALRLNAAASPREVYFQIRNVKIVKKVEGKDVDEWKKQIEMGIEGDGNDAILSRFGRNVKQVRPYWVVRDGDAFEYPSYTGLEMTPPKWTPTGKGDVMRIVYPIIFDDDSIQFFISERDDVSKNLVAHINNTLMNQTFGIAESRFKATADQKKKIDAKKAEILTKARNLGLGALDDPDLQQYISPAWMEYHSREQMLIRKMRNNVVKKIPKDFGSAFVEMIHAESTDESYISVRRQIDENANKEQIDIEPDVKPESTASTQREDIPPSKDTAPPESSKENPPAVHTDPYNEIDQAIMDFESREAVG